MQICFDVFYDDEFEESLANIKIDHSLTKFLVMIPEIFLIFDTLLKFITGFYEDGVIVIDRKEIMHHYLKKGLIFDILSYSPAITQGILRKSFPDIFEGHENLIRYFQMLMFFKINRVKTALSNFEEVIASVGRHDYILTSFRLLSLILFLTHLNACVWHAAAFFNPDTLAMTWLKKSNLNDEYWLFKYLHSLYWSLSMVATIGTNVDNITPQNNIETITAGWILIVSVFVFAFSINSMKQILDMMSKQELEYKFNNIFIFIRKFNKI